VTSVRGLVSKRKPARIRASNCRIEEVARGNDSGREQSLDGKQRILTFHQSNRHSRDKNINSRLALQHAAHQTKSAHQRVSITQCDQRCPADAKDSDVLFKQVGLIADVLRRDDERSQSARAAM